MADTYTSTSTHEPDRFIQSKYTTAKECISRFHSAVIAFSGGVDSTFCAWISKEALGKNNVLLVTAESPSFPAFEKDDAEQFAQMMGLSHAIIASNEMNNTEFTDNGPQRCYYCKKELFSRIILLARQRGFATVLDGTNADDAYDYRPGRKALQELGVHSPLASTGLTKKDIRLLSAYYGLPTADKPAYACLASRFPYGEQITRGKLRRVGNAEAAVRNLGFTQFRIRSHGDCARIELIADEMDKGWSMRETISRCCREAGFHYAAIDCSGYRRGAMNETLASQSTTKEG